METTLQHNCFIVSLAGVNIDLSIINIEEMTGYCNNRGRFANVVTDKKGYGQLEKLNYGLIQNYKHPKPRAIITKNKDYLHVYNSISERYKGGLLIAETDTINDSISECLCTNANWSANDIDIMVCRDFQSMTKYEMERADFLRISADPDFDPFILQKVQEVFKEKTMGIMICQYFVNDQYETFRRYLDRQSEEYKNQGFTDYIDYSEVNKQLSYFIYYDLRADKIVNLDRPVLVEFMKKLAAAGALPIPVDKIEGYAEIIT